MEGEFEDSHLTSSSLELTVEKAVKHSDNLHDIWVCGDLRQKRNLQHLLFPRGLGYDKSNEKVRTEKVNTVFSVIPEIARGLRKNKNGESVKKDQFSDLVTAAGFKPATLRAEI